MPKQRYVDSLLESGWFVGLRYFEGTIFFVVLGREETKVYHEFNAGAALSVNTDAGMATPTDSSSRNLLEPATTDIVHQIFTGISPSNARLFRNFPSGRVIQSLRGSRAIVPGTTATNAVGFFNGWESPYTDPDPRTEIWATKDIVPDFDVFLPNETREGSRPTLNHIVIRYKVGVVQDTDLIKQFVRRERRVKTVTQGSPDALVGSPSFLLEKYSPQMNLTLQEEANAFGTLPARTA